MPIANYCIFILTIVFYFLSSVWSVGSLIKPKRFGVSATNRFMFAGFIIHTFFLIFISIKDKGLPVTNIFESIIFLIWCIILVFVVVDFLYKLKAVLAFLMPFVTVFSIGSILFVGNELSLSGDLQKFWLVAHIIPTFLGYASFGIAFIASIMYITVQRQLRTNFTGTLLTRLPSLEGLDNLIWRTLTFGFPLITLGLVLGFVWIRFSNVLGDNWLLDHKVVLGIAAWLVYAALLHLRMVASFHGTKIAVLTIIGFCMILFTFIGTFFFGAKHGFKDKSDNGHMEAVIMLNEDLD